MLCVSKNKNKNAQSKELPTSEQRDTINEREWKRRSQRAREKKKGRKEYCSIIESNIDALPDNIFCCTFSSFFPQAHDIHFSYDIVQAERGLNLVNFFLSFFLPFAQKKYVYAKSNNNNNDIKYIWRSATIVKNFHARKKGYMHALGWVFWPLYGHIL